MTIARKFLVRNGQVGTYHVTSRCVRRAFLCGQDPYTGQNYEHRKEWIKKRLKFLASLFSLEMCGYAVMSNHVHLMLRMRPDQAKKWDRKEIALRWWKLFPKQRNKDGSPAEPKDYELDQVLFDSKTGQPDGRLNMLRKRLSSMSWFMRCFSENIARRANREDECTGRFWQGRFKSTELLDQAAVLSCLTYIDLNPVHAGIAETPEKSDFTSAQERVVSSLSKEELRRLRAEFHEKKKAHEVKKEDVPVNLEQILADLEVKSKQADWLSPISRWPLDKPVDDWGSFLNMREEDYLSILDWTGRQARSDKPGKIPSNLEPILKRMQIETENWLETVAQFDNWFYRIAGRAKKFIETARNTGHKWLAGKTASTKAFT